jgi:MFS family permease
MSPTLHDDIRHAPDGSYAWGRLALSLLFATLACVGSWSVVVAMPPVQAEFGTLRAAASLPYTMMMIGFAGGAVIMGRLADRKGIIPPMLICAALQAAGYVGAGLASSIWLFAAAHFLVGMGATIGFAPLIADVSHWFRKRRALAVTITATGNYLAGALWSPTLQWGMDTYGWRASHITIGVLLLVTLVPLSVLFRRKAPSESYAAAQVETDARRAGLGLSSKGLLWTLALAGFACCIAMSMPQVHIVSYCADLGYGPAQGANMLALMLGLGIISRIGSGFLADRIGGVKVLLIGSGMQGLALLLYTWFDGLTSLYIISAIFGLFQGGIVPMYAVIVREYLPPREAGAKVGIVVTATIIGMAVGGLVSGAINDIFSSYRIAFLNGVAWNIVNLAVVAWLLMKPRQGRLAAA